MRLTGLVWGLVLGGSLGLGGCVHYLLPEEPVRYESDPSHYPYYRPVPPVRGTGFYPSTNPGIVVGGPRNGSVVYEGKVYHNDGTMDFLRR